MERARQISDSIELGIVLSLIGGFMDAYSYIGRGGVFANAQTGNLLLMGVHLSQGNIALSTRFLMPVLSFGVGIVVADIVRTRLGRTIHWRQIVVLAEALILALVAFLAPEANLVANCLTSFACGMQVESFRAIHGHSIATTMCIGNLRSCLQSVDSYVFTHKKRYLERALLYFGVILTFVLGAVLGNLCVDMFAERAMLVASIMCMFAFALMFIDREQQFVAHTESVAHHTETTAQKTTKLFSPHQNSRIYTQASHQQSDMSISEEHGAHHAG
ncbi:DUF1275 domain-containing protein [Collinsella sp. zg1085]|uniref:YoaK family protein n=1 Tax=Collinsella sp. zg1085 TaxID=2844380 RepID=UPI001C0D3A3F|nr:YoaK family protein [Collinsella sp. zg1085]QWT18157.1 DUF1275 domain-containing protein [Collinsella sp. zg1085]